MFVIVWNVRTLLGLAPESAIILVPKNSLSLSIPLLLEVLRMEQPDDGFLKYFLLKMCVPRIIALLVPTDFTFKKNLIDGFILKKEFQ